MVIEVKLPELGADPEEVAVVSAWFADVNDTVVEGDRLVELLVGSTTFDLPAPAGGRLAQILVLEDEEVATGALLGTIQPEESDEEL